ILAQVEALCDSVSIIRRGRLVEAGSLAELRHLSRLSVSVETARAPTELATAAGVHDLRVDGHAATFELDHDHLNDVIGRLHRLGLHSLHSSPPSLEQLFLRHYDDQPEPAGPRR